MNKNQDSAPCWNLWMELGKISKSRIHAPRSKTYYTTYASPTQLVITNKSFFPKFLLGGYDECRFKTSFSYWADVPGNNGRYHFCLWRPLFVYLTTWQVISSRAVLSPSFSIDGPTHRNWSDTHINNFSLRGTTQCHSTFSEIVDHRQWTVKKWDKNETII